MELVYGKGLYGLYGDDGKIDHKRFGQDRVRHYGETYIEITGVDNQVSGASAEAFVYGFVSGLQYAGLTDDLAASVVEDAVMSNCFYAAKGVMGSITVISDDFKNLGKVSGEWNWVNIILYDPLHIMGDFTVVYEMCNFYELIDKLVGLFSMDWAALGEQVTQLGIYLGAYAKDMFIDIADNIGEDCLKETMAIAQDLIDEGNQILADFLEDQEAQADADGTKFEVDVDSLMDVIKDQGDNANALLTCMVSDIDLYAVGHDTGVIFSRALQVQLDATN